MFIISSTYWALNTNLQSQISKCLKRKKKYLKNFSGFEESCVLAAAECENQVQDEPPVLLLKHHAVRLPGASGGARGARWAAAALTARVLNQTLLPAGERRCLRRTVRLHDCSSVCVGLKVCFRERGECVSVRQRHHGLKYLLVWATYGDELRKYVEASPALFYFFLFLKTPFTSWYNCLCLWCKNRSFRRAQQ